MTATPDSRKETRRRQPLGQEALDAMDTTDVMLGREIGWRDKNNQGTLLDQLDRREQEATAGPWEAVAPSRYGPSSTDHIATIHNNVGSGDDLTVYGAWDVILGERGTQDFSSWHGRENAVLIALSRNHLRALIEVARAAEKPRLEELVVGGMGEFCRLCERPVRRHHKNCALAPLLAKEPKETNFDYLGPDPNDMDGEAWGELPDPEELDA